MNEPRAIERDYLATLRDIITPAAWREIVTKALDDAKAGNPQARAWIARYVLGAQPMTLTALAVRESLGVSPYAEVEATAWHALEPYHGEAQDALGLGNLEIGEAQKIAERERRRARREAKKRAAENDAGGGG